MVTEAPKTLFNPDFSKAQVEPLLKVALPVMREILHHGLALFARCSYRPDGDDENLVILFTYRHLLELLDSIIIQIAECAPAPAALHLRAMFESLLTIEYITQDKAKSRSRALAYLHQVELQRRRFYLSQEPGTPEGKAFLESIEDDPYRQVWKPMDSADVADRVKEIDAMLARADLKEIGDEYRRTKKANKRKPPWYGLYNGPQHLAALAQRLKRGASYALLYKEWSERGHSVDAIDRILTDGSSGPAARGLRDPTELNSNIDFAIAFSLEAARMLIRYYRPDEGEAFEKWREREAMPGWQRIPKVTVK